MEILKLKKYSNQNEKTSLNGFSNRLEITEERVSLISVQSEQQRRKKDWNNNN